MIDETEICERLLKWVDHTKEGYRRSEESLRYFDELWIWTSNLIRNLECKAELDEEEIDFIKLIKFEGKLFRVHKKYNIYLPNFGVDETEHYVSWTKLSNITDLYWVYESTDCIVISAETTPSLFGIDLVGYSNYMQKYYYPKYSLGTSAILKEQEVVFPVKMETIIDIERNKKMKK